MEQNIEVKFHYIFFIALVIHLFIISFITLPYYFSSYTTESYLEEIFHNLISDTDMRDVIVNINPDNLEIETKETLFSDVTSSAKGHITEQRGDNWLNNSLQFNQKQKQARNISKASASQIATPLLQSKTRSDFVVSFFNDEKFIEQEITPEKKPIEDKKKKLENVKKVDSGSDSVSRDGIDWSSIPDQKGVTLENALYYNNSDYFSFNTKKFANFEYFRKMKQKIAGNWHPPVMANSLTTGYTPGHIRVKILDSEEVKTYFILNRNGDVKKVVLLETRGNKSLHDSCVDAIRHSRSFGPVPEEIKGEVIVIPFIFGYYVR